MASEKNITMRQYNGVDYDTLYPKTKVEQVEGAYTQQQILADSTKTLFGLGADAVPDDALVALNGLIGNNKDSVANLSSVSGKVEYGSYVGTGVFTANKVVNFQGKPFIFAIEESSSKVNANIFVRPFYAGTHGYNNEPNLAAWNENSVSIKAYSNSQWSYLSLNTAGSTYNWVAICL